MADWAGNDTGSANDVNSSPGADVGSSSASGSSSGSSSDFWSNPANTPAGREAAAMANTGLSSEYTSSSDPGRYAATATYDTSGQISGYTANPSAGVGGAAGEQARAIASAQASSQATPSNIALMEASLPGANVYNQMANAINAARQPGATGASVRASVNYYNNPTDITGRAGYTYISQLGDSGTQRLIDQGYSPMYALSQQLLSAYRTPGTTDERFYLNELSKANHNYVEASSGYHHWGMKTNLPVAANPFEYTGDLALALEKGIGGKSGAQITTPTNLSVLSLPNGLSLQDAAWNLAKGEKYQVDFSQPISVIDKAATLGTMGVYGNLNSYSSTLGIISLQGQQDIAMRASKGAEWVVHPEMLARNPAQNMRALGYGIEYQSKPASERLVGGKVVAATTQVSADRVGITPTSPAGVEIAMAEGGLPRPFVSGGKGAVVEPTLLEKAGGSLQQGSRMTLASIPGAMGLVMASDISFAIASGKKENLPFYDVIKTISTPYSQPEGSVTTSEYESNLAKYNSALSSYNVEKGVYEKLTTPPPEEYSKLTTSYEGLQSEQSKLETQKQNIVNPPTAFDTIGNVYEGLNKGLAPYTTDITGMGKAASETTTSQDNWYDIARGVYSGATQHPLDIVVTFAGGEAFGLAGYVAKYGVAKAVATELPIVSTVGRGLSTPLASEMANVGLAIGGAYVLGSATGEIISQPTWEKKGESLGRTAIQFAGFGAGYGTVNLAEPFNEYSGKGFFSKQQQMGPLEQMSYELRVELLARSQPTGEQATLIRTAGQLGGSSARFNEAPIKAEPIFEKATALGEDYGPLMKMVSADKSNPTIIKGSMVVASQYPESTVIEAGIRTPHDMDALTFDVGAMFETIAVKSRVGGIGKDVGVIYPSKKVPSGMVSDWSGTPISENVGMGKVFHHTEYPSKGKWLTPEEHTLFHNIDQGVVAKTAANAEFYEKYLITTPRITGGGAVPGPKQFSTAQEVMASGIADLRPIPPNYPGFAASVTPDVRPAEISPVSFMERIMGNPFERVAGPRSVSEELISGKTKGYTGETNSEAAQAQFGRKVGSALKDFAQDPIGQGYRGQKDLYDVISEYTAQKITARESGIDVTKGDWAKNDAAISKMLDVTLRVGSDKGQKEGGELINLREWFLQKQVEVRGKPNMREESSWLPKESPKSGSPISLLSQSLIYSSGSASRVINPPSAYSNSVSSTSMASISLSQVSPSKPSPSVLQYPSVLSPSPLSPFSTDGLILPSNIESPIPSITPSPIPPSPGYPEIPSGSPAPSPIPLPPSPSIRVPPSPIPPSTPPSPIPPIIPRPPGIPFLGNGGGSSNGIRFKGPRHTEIFSYAPKNLKGLYGMPKGRTPAIKKRK